MCDWCVRVASVHCGVCGVCGECGEWTGTARTRLRREAWRARSDRAVAASARAPPASCERRRFYGSLRELPAPRAKGTREALGAGSGRAR